MLAATPAPAREAIVAALAALLLEADDAEELTRADDVVTADTHRDDAA